MGNSKNGRGRAQRTTGALLTFTAGVPSALGVTSFVTHGGDPGSPAYLPPTSMQTLTQIALTASTKSQGQNDQALRHAIVAVANSWLQMVPNQSPTQLENRVWQMSSLNGVNDGEWYDEWCAAFATLVLHQGASAVGEQSWITQGGTYPWPLWSWSLPRVNTNPASLQIISIEQAAKQAGRWHPLGDGYTPQPGDFAIFDGHVEVVTNYDSGSNTLYTIGGNAGPNLTVHAGTYQGPGANGIIAYVNNGNLMPAANLPPGLQPSPKKTTQPTQAPPAGTVQIPGAPADFAGGTPSDAATGAPVSIPGVGTTAPPSSNGHGSSNGHSPGSGNGSTVTIPGVGASGTPSAQPSGSPNGSSGTVNVPGAGPTNPPASPPASSPPPSGSAPWSPTPTSNPPGAISYSQLNRIGQGVDYSWTIPPLQTFSQNGFTFSMQYIPGPGIDPAMSLNTDRVAGLAAQHIKIGLIYEDGGNTGPLTYQDGVSQGQKALAYANGAGVPSDVPIFCTVDYATTQSQIPQMLQFVRGFASVVGAGRTGVYGNYLVVSAVANQGVARYTWQTSGNASMGQVDPRIDMYQFAPATAYNGNADLDWLMNQNMPFWEPWVSQAPAAQPSPSASSQAPSSTASPTPSAQATTPGAGPVSIPGVDTPSGGKSHAPVGTGTITIPGVGPSGSPNGSTPSAAPTPSGSPPAANPPAGSGGQVQIPGVDPTSTVTPTSPASPATSPTGGNSNPSPAPSSTPQPTVTPGSQHTGTHVKPAPPAEANVSDSQLSSVQLRTANIILTEAYRLGISQYGAGIGVATAMQESQLGANLPNGAGGSWGIFSQQPASGWGTETQVQDPWFASHAFFDALKTKVPNYNQLPVWQAAYAVQNCAAQYKMLYQNWASLGANLAAQAYSQFGVSQPVPAQSPANGGEDLAAALVLGTGMTRLRPRRSSSSSRAIATGRPAPSVVVLDVRTTHNQIPLSVERAFTPVGVRAVGNMSIYESVADEFLLPAVAVAALDVMQCEANPSRSAVFGEPLGRLNDDGSSFATKEASLRQACSDLIHEAAKAYPGLDLTASGVSVSDWAKAFAAFRWGKLLVDHSVSAMEFPYSVAGLTDDLVGLRWPNIPVADAPDKPGSKYRIAYGAVTAMLLLGYPAVSNA